MTTVEEIKDAIDRLSAPELRQLVASLLVPGEKEGGEDVADVRLYEERKDEPVKPMEEVFSELGL